MKLFLSADPAGGGGAVPSPQTPPEPTNAPAPPPAGSVVVHGPRSERETELESELCRERDAHSMTAKEKKEREVHIAELQDELSRLKAAPAEPGRPARGAMEEFFGWD
jgi:hypothetical protein